MLLDSGRWEKCEFPLLWFFRISPRKLDKFFNGRLSGSPPRPYVTEIDKRCSLHVHPSLSLPPSLLGGLGAPSRCLGKIGRRFDRATDLAPVCFLRNSLHTFTRTQGDPVVKDRSFTFLDVISSFLLPYILNIYIKGEGGEMDRKFSPVRVRYTVHSLGEKWLCGLLCRCKIVKKEATISL